MRCAIWYHLYNSKNAKNTPPWVFFAFFKLYKWYKIAQNITEKYSRSITSLHSEHLDLLWFPLWFPLTTTYVRHFKSKIECKKWLCFRMGVFQFVNCFYQNNCLVVLFDLQSSLEHFNLFRLNFAW